MESGDSIEAVQVESRENSEEAAIEMESCPEEETSDTAEASDAAQSLPGQDDSASSSHTVHESWAEDAERTEGAPHGSIIQKALRKEIFFRSESPLPQAMR